MATICITGSTDGIGLAAARELLGSGHRVLVHARTAERGQPVVADLDGDVALVTGDLSSLASTRTLAGQLREHGPLDVLVHNAGVWLRDGGPSVTGDGFETTFAVNVLAPHLLTSLVADLLTDRLLWLGSGLAASGRPKPTALGASREPRQAYADSKACDVALAIGWGRRLPGITSAAIDPGWVKSKLAGPGAPGSTEQGADTVAWCCTTGQLATASYWKDRAPAQVPGRLRDAGLQDALVEQCDRLAGLADPGRLTR